MTPLRLAFSIVAAAIALALPTSALAGPTLPHVHPVPATVTVFPGMPFAIGWDASSFDPGVTAGYYEVSTTRSPIGNTSSSSTTTDSAGCCTYALQLVPGYHYVVRVRAVQFFWCGVYGPCQLSWSTWWPVWFDAVSLPVAGF